MVAAARRAAYYCNPASTLCARPPGRSFKPFCKAEIMTERGRYTASSPLRSARATASVRLPAPSFVRIEVT